MSKTFIHLGANKTASTLLQRRLFSNIKNSIYFGQDSNVIKDSFEIINSIIFADDNEFVDLSIKKYLESYNFYDLNQNRIISSEDLISNPHPTTIAKRIKKLFPEAKLLLIIRNQIDAISSWYLSHGSGLKKVPREYWRRFVNFNDSINFLVDFQDFSFFNAFNYNKHYEIYSKLYGEENIIVIPFELLELKPDIFFQDIYDFFEGSIQLKEIREAFKHNERKGRSSIDFILHKILKDFNLSKKIYNSLKFLDIFLPPINRKSLWNKKNKAKIFNAYSIGNTKLNLKIKYDLNKLGYPTE